MKKRQRSDPHQSPDGPAASGGGDVRARPMLFYVCWGYLALLTALWLVIRFGGDRWWPATLLMFGPRWLTAVPLAVLIPLAWRSSRKLLGVLALTAVVSSFCVLGFCIPWRLAITARPAGPRLRVLTCNLHWGQDLNAQAFQELIAEQNPDIVTIQEYGAAGGHAFETPGWHIVCTDELYLATRWPVRDLGKVPLATWSEVAAPRRGTAHLYQILVRGRAVPFVQVHLASPHNDFSAALRAHIDAPDSIETNSGLRLLEAQVVGNMARNCGPAVLMAGDFNTPSESFIFRENFAGLSDAFSAAGFGFGWTYYHRGTAVRIDHVLCGPHWRCTTCRVAGDMGSPHRPLIAEFVPR